MASVTEPLTACSPVSGQEPAFSANGIVARMVLVDGVTVTLSSEDPGPLVTVPSSGSLWMPAVDELSEQTPTGNARQFNQMRVTSKRPKRKSFPLTSTGPSQSTPTFGTGKSQVAVVSSTAEVASAAVDVNWLPFTNHSADAASAVIALNAKAARTAARVIFSFAGMM